MTDSVFTKIIREELPAEVLHRDADHIVILSHAPHNPGHSLVIPTKQTTGNFWEMDASDLSSLVLKAQKIAQVIKEVLMPKRVGLVFEGFGVTDHVHVNLIPINQPGDLDHDRAKPVTTEELSQIAQKLKPAIEKKLG